MSEQVTSPTSLHTLFLEEPPCCLEFVPALPDHFVLGTYHLERREGGEKDDDGDSSKMEQEDKESTPIASSQSRSGRLHLFSVLNDRIHEVHQCRVEAAVLDLRFAPCHLKNTSNVFASATSLGFIGLYAIDVTQTSSIRGTEDDTQSSAAIRHMCNIQVLPRDELITSLMWNPLTSADEGERAKIALTSTSGNVFELDLHIGLSGIRQNGSTKSARVNSEPELVKSLVQTHGAEAWIVAYGLCGPSDDGVTILSGGDDACLMSSTASGGQEFSPDWTNRKMHAAGVTAIIPLREELIATGSYDDRLRIVELSKAMGGRPVLRHEIHLGGGVWRIQPFDVEDRGEAYKARLLVSCMYAGAFIVSIETDGQKWHSEVLARFQQHQSMNYACGLVKAEDAVHRFVSCSFYDRRLCLWSR